MTSYLTSIDTCSLSRTVFEILDFKVFRVWPWPLTFRFHPRSKIFPPVESPYMTSYLTSIDTCSLSRTVFEIFDFKVFRVWCWPLTLSQKYFHHSKAHIWLPILLLLTLALHLVPFSRYSTWKFLGFDLDLWPFGVTRGQKYFHHSKAHIWLPLLLLLTLALYLVPFSRYSTSKFLGFDLDLWPSGVTRGRKYFHHSKAHIWLHILLLLTLALYLVPFSRYSTLKFLGFDLDFWPLGVTLGEKYSHHFEAHIWLPISLLLTLALYLVSFSRYSTSKFWGFDLDFWPLGVTLIQKYFYFFWSLYMTSYLTYIDTCSPSRTVFEIFDLNIFWVWSWLLTFRGDPRSKIFSLFWIPYMTSYLTSIDTCSLSRTVFEIFDFKVFGVWPWLLTFRGHLRSKVFPPF